MRTHLQANLWLFAAMILLCCVIYPGLLLLVGQFAFPSQADGSLAYDRAGNPVGSQLIAQPFTHDEFFQPRPSAVSYNAAASGGSNLGANNPVLRDRIARQLGPIVRYRSGTKAHQLVRADIERWFREDRFGGKPGIVAQWAQRNPTIAKNWIDADNVTCDFVLTWKTTHKAEVDRWIAENPDTPNPKPEELAVPYFVDYSKLHPGSFPVETEHKRPGGDVERTLEPANQGTVIQSLFFNMWRQEHPHEDLEPVPADAVMASGSGLDPHITLKNALFQLDRVTDKWASETHGDRSSIHAEIESLLRQSAHAPLGGLAGVDLINVLDINRALEQRYRPAS